MALGLIWPQISDKKSARAAVKIGFWACALSASAFAQIPASWHQPLSQQERIQYGWGGPNTPVTALRRVPDFPKVRILAVPGDVVKKNASPNMQINAWENKMVIFVPVEMIRWLNDQQMLTFLIAHEAGHAQQEQLYGQSCYTAPNVKFSTFDVLRSLGDIAGGAATKGGSGAAESLANLKMQACEDDADARAVKLMREAGLDPSAGIRLFTKLQQLQGTYWQALAQQFTSDHSIGPVRIAHIAILAKKEAQ
jgi:Zn-dependent protease with chaperone function